MLNHDGILIVRIFSIVLLINILFSSLLNARDSEKDYRREKHQGKIPFILKSWATAQYGNLIMTGSYL
jgi:hypothetical protein